MLLLLACSPQPLEPGESTLSDSSADSVSESWGTVDVLVRDGPAILRVHDPDGDLVTEREIEAGALTLDVLGGSSVSAALEGEASVWLDMVMDVQPGDSLALLDAPLPTGPEISVHVASLPEGAARVRMAVLDCHAVASKDLSSAPNSMSIRLYADDCLGRPVAWVEDEERDALAFLVLEPAALTQLEEQGITLDDWRTDWAWSDVADAGVNSLTLSGRDTERRPIFSQPGPGRLKALPLGPEHIWLSALGQIDDHWFQVLRQEPGVPEAMALSVPEAFITSIEATLTPDAVEASWSEAPGERAEVLHAFTVDHPELAQEAGLFWTVWPGAGATRTELPPAVYERVGDWGHVSVSIEDAEVPSTLRGRRTIDGPVTWVEASESVEP